MITSATHNTCRHTEYSNFFIYSYPSFGKITYRSDRRLIFMLDDSNNADAYNDAPFGGFAPHLGGQITQKSQLWGVNKHFQTICAKY